MINPKSYGIKELVLPFDHFIAHRIDRCCGVALHACILREHHREPYHCAVPMVDGLTCLRVYSGDVGVPRALMLDTFFLHQGAQLAHALTPRMWSENLRTGVV